jgi:hypothetical protein
MKKALAILMVLAAVTGVAFADVADIAVSGDATVSWGYSFENEASGFLNASDWKISIPLLAAKDFTTKGEGDSYAEISIKAAEFTLVNEEDDRGDADKDGDTEAAGDLWYTFIDGGTQDVDGVSAKLVFGNVYAAIANGTSDTGHDGGPDFSPEYATVGGPVGDSGFENEYDDDEYSPDFTGDHMGLKVGYKTEKFDIALKLASKYDWSVTTDRSLYAFGVDAIVTPMDMISVDATANYAAWKGDKSFVNTDGKSVVTDNIITLGTKVVVKPIADLAVTFGIDAGNNKIGVTGGSETAVAKYEQVFAWDAIAKAAYKFIEGGAYITSNTGYVDMSTDSWVSYDESKTYELAGTDKYGNNVIAFNPYLKVTDGDFVENLDAWVTFMAVRVGAYNAYLKNSTDTKLTEFTPYEFSVGANYKAVLNDVNYVKPYFNFFGQNAFFSGKRTEDLATKYSIGAEYGLFSNAIITADYTSGAIDNSDDLELVTTASENDKGLFKLSCKVTY